MKLLPRTVSPGRGGQRNSTSWAARSTRWRAQWSPMRVNRSAQRTMGGHVHAEENRTLPGFLLRTLNIIVFGVVDGAENVGSGRVRTLCGMFACAQHRPGSAQVSLRPTPHQSPNRPGTQKSTHLYLRVYPSRVRAWACLPGVQWLPSWLEGQVRAGRCGRCRPRRCSMRARCRPRSASTRSSAPVWPMTGWRKRWVPER